ncbi:hypothetical protein [Methylorubrum populi]
MFPDASPPLFLTREGYAEALRIFDLFTENDSRSIREAVDRAVARLSGSAWSEFDGVYLSLYTLSLLNRTRALRLDAPRADDGDLPHRVSVEFFLDLKLRNDHSPRRLLDERGVAHFMNFRRAVEGLIPFKMTPRSLGFGCIYVEFEVFLPRLPAIGDGQASRGVGEEGFVASFLAGREWESLIERFNVADVAVHGPT